MEASTKKVLFTSLAVNFTDIVINLTVALITNSTVMLTETFQGIVDSTAVAFLVIGHKRSQKAPTKLHPFGFGKELYFWTAMATFIMLSVTAVYSFLMGLRQFRNPEELDFLFLSFIVLTVSALTNGYSVSLSAKKLIIEEKTKNIFKAFFASTRVELKTSFILDSIGVIMATIGLIALTIAQFTGNYSFDGLGAMIMATMLAIMALVLLSNVRNLVVGQSADAETEEKIRQLVEADPAVERVIALRTMILGSESMIINLEVKLRTGDFGKIKKILDRLREDLEQKLPGKQYIQIEPE